MNNPELPYIITTESGARLAVAAIELLEREAGESNGAYSRRCERAAWHSLARTLLGDPRAQFSYNEVGAPLIVGSPLFLGVSHSSSLVAVVVSSSACALDIESLSRDFERVASRYIAPAEAHLSQCANFYALIWSIKETLYKYAGRKELSLRDDLSVLSLGEGRFEATIAPHTERVCGRATVVCGHTLVYIG